MPRSSETSSGPSPSAEPAAGAVPLGAGALRIRLTPPGAFAVALVLGAGVVAVNSGNNLLYLVVATLLALFGISGILGHRNLAGVRLRVLPPEEAWAGRPVSVRVLLDAAPGRPSYLLSVGEPPGARTATAVEIPRGGRAALDLELRFPARGPQPWPALEVSSEFPFGLIRRGRVLPATGHCLVYPRPLAVAWERVARAEREGELAARRGTGGGDYRGLRDYAPGDSISRVQWTSWLRLRRLQTKEFETEGAPPVVYAFDAVPGPGVEERLGQLAWLVRTATRRGRATGLELPGRTIPPGTGAAHRRTLLDALARFKESR